MEPLHAPFPWFGGKSRIAPLVWQRFGDVANYVEPFAGSLAVLLGRPTPPRVETVNDKDALVCNFWRALQADPDGVASWANWPVNESDLHARHVWLRAQLPRLAPTLEGDPHAYDVKIAGWWVWGLACWIGGRFCGASSGGPWGVNDDGQLVHLGNAGRGVTRRLVHLGDAGRGVTRRRVHLGDAGPEGLLAWMRALADRLQRVRVCCGDWARVMGKTPTIGNGLTGIVLDPPYSAEADRDPTIYACEDLQVAHDVRAWALAHGDDPQLRIALCGYEGEHEMPSVWAAVPWKAYGGYGVQGDARGRTNAAREVVWFSPHCLGPADPRLF